MNSPRRRTRQRSPKTARVPRWMQTVVWGALLVLTLAVLLALPSGRALRMAWQLKRSPAPRALPVPVEGVRPQQIADTWGGIRSGGRHHEGVDIFAPRGTPVRSSTPGVVLDVSNHGLGGRQVWVLGPAGERHYYAHLDNWAVGLHAGDVVAPGTLLGFVGDSGNARGTPTHLHYGIYRAAGAYNPWPLLQAQAITHTSNTRN